MNSTPTIFNTDQHSINNYPKYIQLAIAEKRRMRKTSGGQKSPSKLNKKVKILLIDFFTVKVKCNLIYKTRMSINYEVVPFALFYSLTAS